MPGLRTEWEKLRAAPPGERTARMRRRLLAEARTRWHRLRHPNVELGPGVLVQGPLRVSGRGRVVFGERCRIDGVDIQLHSPDAVVRFGRECYVNYPEIRSAAGITFGDRCIVGSALVLDTDFHSVGVGRHRPDAPVRTLPITIGDDVWLAARTSVLPGVTIGNGSVVALGTVVHGDVPPGVVVGPSPMRVLGDVPPAVTDVPPAMVAEVEAATARVDVSAEDGEDGGRRDPALA